MIGNLTSAAFKIVHDDFDVREALHDNNTQTAYTALTNAGSYLFALSNSLVSQIGSTIEQQFVSLRDQIERLKVLRSSTSLLLIMLE